MHKPLAWPRAKAVMADMAPPITYHQRVFSASLQIAHRSLPERAGPQSTAPCRVRLWTLRNGHSNTGIEAKSRAMAVLVNCALDDVWRCLRLPIMGTQRDAQLTTGGTAAQGLDGGAVVAPTRTCVGASTWKRTASMREYWMRLPRRTLRMAWILRAILSDPLPRVRCVRAHTWRLSQLRINILAWELLIAEHLLLGSAVVAVALVRGARRAQHSLPEFRRHQRLDNCLTLRGRRPPPKQPPGTPPSPNHQRRFLASPVTTTLRPRHPLGYLRWRHRCQRSAGRALPRLPNPHQ
jgi:hypothetical protein